MKWQTKAFILRQLSQIPLGKRLYLLMQKMAGSNRPQPGRDFARIVELLGMIKEAGQSSQGGIFFEIGSGWHPYAPLGCYLAGAEKIITVDVNPWMSLKSARECVTASEDHLAQFAEAAGLDESTVSGRYRDIDLAALKLDKLLASMRTEYQSPGDASRTGLESQSVDFIISSNVLEHIPAPVLKAITEEAFRILKPGGLYVHRFNPGDHYANDDNSVSTANFLQYSSTAWKKYGEGLAYHNRLRCSEFSKIFREAGFVSLLEKKRVDPQARQVLENKSITLNDEFEKFSLEDLAADYMWYTGMKPTAISVDSQSNAMGDVAFSQKS